VLGVPCHVTAPGEQTGNGDVLVEFFPMQANAAQLGLFALRGTESAREVGYADVDWFRVE